MARLRFSSRARADLRSIAEYTRTTWSAAQAERYLDQIKGCCQRLAEQPSLGRAFDEVRPGLFRMNEGKHVVFYRPLADGIRVIAILHQRRLPELHLADSKDDE